MAKNASAAEVEAARAFLKFLGRDWHNNGLVLAVIVWARVASGRLSGSLGNNPFRLYKKGSQYVPYGYGGTHAATFSSLTQSFIAAAKALKYLAKAYPKGGTFVAKSGQTFKAYSFNELLIAFRSGDAGQVLQAIAMSNWKKDHYGFWVSADGKEVRSKLISTYKTYDGVITPEAQAAADAEKARQEAEQRKWEAEERARKAALAKYKRRPKQLNPPVLGRDYLDPYAVGRNYREKHPPYELPE